jgi:hypothetical protein
VRGGELYSGTSFPAAGTCDPEGARVRIRVFQADLNGGGPERVQSFVAQGDLTDGF